MAYVTVSDLKIYANMDADDTAPDVHLGAAIDEAQDYIERITNKRFETGESEEASDLYFYSDSMYDYNKLWLGTYVLSVDSITDADGNEIADYVLIPRNADRFHEIMFTDDYPSVSETDAITVSAIEAFSNSPPDAIVRATARLALYFYHLDRSGDFGRLGFDSGGGQSVISTKIPADVLSLLEPFMEAI